MTTRPPGHVERPWTTPAEGEPGPVAPEPPPPEAFVWRERYDLPWSVPVGESEGVPLTDRLRHIVERFQRRTSIGDSFEGVLGVAPVDDVPHWLLLDLADVDAAVDIVANYFEGSEAEDVVAVALGTAPAGSVASLPEFDGW